MKRNRLSWHGHLMRIIEEYNIMTKKVINMKVDGHVGCGRPKKVGINN